MGSKRFKRDSKTSMRFTKEHLDNGELIIRLLEETHQNSLLLTLKVENYSKLRKGVLFYKPAVTSDYRWHLELVKVKGTLFVILSTNFNNKVVQFIILSGNCENTRINEAEKISRTDQPRSIYVSEFCNNSILNPHNKYLPDDVLTVLCKYYIDPDESNRLLFPSDQLRKEPDVHAPNDYFKNIYYNAVCADFTIKAQNGFFRVHKSVLDARTLLFKRLYNMDGVKACNRHETSIHTPCKIMNRVLLYIYSGEFNVMDVDSMMEVFSVSCCLNIPSLRRWCVNFLKANILENNARDMFQVALIHDDIELKNAAMRFLLSHVENVRSVTGEEIS